MTASAGQTRRSTYADVVSELSYAFHDLPADRFPFVIEFLSASGVVVHRQEVPGPGAIKIPGLAPLFGPVTTRVIFPDGSVVEQSAPKGER